MVRLSSLPPDYAQNLLNLPLPEYDSTPWARPSKPLRQMRIAIISTAGVGLRGEPPYGFAGEYRVLPGDIEDVDIALNHVSINFDRTGFQQDVNVVFPLQRLKELAQAGKIGSVADYHYSFMGATDPTRMEESAAQVAELLKQDGVDGAILVPV